MKGADHKFFEYSKLVFGDEILLLEATSVQELIKVHARCFSKPLLLLL
jgi:hypothetical protein